MLLFSELMYQIHFFCTFACLFGRLRVFFRALGCEARKGAACTPRHKCGSRPGSVARALGVQSRAIWQVTTGSLSTSPSLAGQWKPHNLIS